jgi:hypothetical protein
MGLLTAILFSATLLAGASATSRESDAYAVVEAACKFVHNVPNAVAVVEAASLGDNSCTELNVARVQGKLPSDEGYPLR